MKSIIVFLIFFVGNFYFLQSQSIHIEKLIANGQISTAINLLNEEISKAPIDEAALLLRGDLYSYIKNWDAALEDYKVLVEKYPNNADYHFKYGGALGLKALNVNRFKALTLIPDVKKYLERATSLDPSHIASRRALVELYMQLPGMLGGSEQKATEFAKQLSPYSKVDALLAIAYIHKEAGREKKAADLYQQAFKSYKSASPEARNDLNYELGEIAANYNVQPQVGLSFLNKYLENHSYRDTRKPEWAHYRKAQIFTQLQNKEKAIESINRAVMLNPGFEEAKMEKARILRM